jgi:hypothetical protein
MGDVLHIVGSKLYRFVPVTRIQTAQPIFNSQNIFHTVAVKQGHGY